MNKIKDIKSVIYKFLDKWFLLFFAVITFFIAINHIPFWDEARAFAASCLKLSGTIYIAKIDGHTLLWYFLLKPINSIKFYPYPMLILNWLLAMTAYYILWTKSPFCIKNKILILLSYPFLFYFPIIARGYSLALIFLFLVCTYYKDRFKNTNLFSICLILSANIEIVCSIPCFYLGLTHLFELIKNKEYKTFKKSFLIYLLGCLLLIFQIIGYGENNLVAIHLKWNTSMLRIIVNLCSNQLCLLYHLLGLVILLSTIFIFKSRKAKFFIVGTNLTLFLILFLAYSGATWNYYFFYIYLIISFWLFYDNIPKNKIFTVILSIYFLLSCIPFLVNNHLTDIFIAQNSNSDKIALHFKNNPKYKNAKLYCMEWWSSVSPGADIYFKKNNLKLYDYDNLDRLTFESMKKVYDNLFRDISFQEFEKNIDKSKENYIISTGNLFNMKLNKDNKELIELLDTKIKKYEIIPEYKIIVFKIENK